MGRTLALDCRTGRTPAFRGTRGCAGDEVRQVVLSKRPPPHRAHREHLIEPRGVEIAVDQYKQLIGIDEWGRGPSIR